jgi:hypothetical protein
VTKPGLTFRVDADQRANLCKEVTTSARLPMPFDHRLSQLVDAANAAGAGADKKWLLAALILDATSDGDELAAMVQRARRATAREVVLGVPANVQFLELERRPVGRPRLGR